jgi:hypothetical protein
MWISSMTEMVGLSTRKAQWREPLMEEQLGRKSFYIHRPVSGRHTPSAVAWRVPYSMAVAAGLASVSVIRCADALQLGSQ